MAVTDEVRYGWKFVHSDDRHAVPRVRGEGPFLLEEAPLAYETAYAAVTGGLADGSNVLIVVSPMLSCEDAYLLAAWVAGLDGDGTRVTFAVGPVPFDGEDKTFADGFTLRDEKAPNARGVRRVLAKFAKKKLLEFDDAVKAMGDADAVVLTGNYPSDWVTPDLVAAFGHGAFLVLIDTLPNGLTDRADVVLPAATWVEKAGKAKLLRPEYTGELEGMMSKLFRKTGVA